MIDQIIGSVEQVYKDETDTEGKRKIMDVLIEDPKCYGKLMVFLCPDEAIKYNCGDKLFIRVKKTNVTEEEELIDLLESGSYF
jgi:hypothetical protein